MKLSFLNLLEPPRGTGVRRYFDDLSVHAREAERFGLHRYWLTEHHTWIGDSAPSAAVQAIASATTRIRVGAGGCLAQYHNPRQLMEHFALLAGLFPGRIDLGICRALVNERVHRQLTAESSQEQYFNTHVRLLDAVTSFRDADDLVDAQHVELPELWVLGSGPGAADLAATRQIAYCRSLFHAMAGTPEPQPDRRMKARAVAVAGVCSDSEGEALCRLGDIDSTFYLPTIAGNPGQCIERLEEICAEYDVDEVFFSDLTTGADARLQSIRLLGAAYKSSNANQRETARR